LPFDENLRFAIDLDFFCQVYKTGPFVKLNDYLGAFRCHADNKSSTIAEVGRAETERRWGAIFQDDPNGWQNRPPTCKVKSFARLLQRALTIALPYFYRRFFLGLRGMETETMR